ncbi:MAG: nucleotide exchange factor GrpE [Chloroflexi bacterium]|nr:nucleotide exchange factor GrpE [Chloroflexota bacterium]
MGNEASISSETGASAEDLQAQLQAAREEAAQLHDKYLRALAESENMRKRLERLCEERMWEQKRSLLGRFLEVADNIERALSYIDSPTGLREGLRATYAQLQSFLREQGITSIPAVGEAFDPNVHEAVEIIPGQGDELVVTEEYRKGYLCGDRLLRPARVQVTHSNNRS